jgi:membrane fusion protein, multidrug efflux system
MKRISFLYIAIITIFTTNCSSTHEKKEQIVIPISEISTSMMTDAGENYIGSVEEESGTILSFEVAGNIQKLNSDVGKHVVKGQTLAILDRTNLSNTYNISLSSLKQTQDVYRRYENLHKAGCIPDIKWVEIENKLQQTSSAERIARKQLNNSILRAPFSGVIASRNADQGMNISPGEPIFKLVRVKNMYVKVAVPEKEISGINIGNKATITVSALNESEYKGIVVEKGIIADKLSHSYDVKILVNNRKELLLPGMVCSVCLKHEKYNSDIVVPICAVQINTNGKKFVWIDNNGFAVRRYVETGNLKQNDIIIKKGLNYGEKVITKGYQKICDGMKIISKQ